MQTIKSGVILVSEPENSQCKVILLITNGPAGTFAIDLTGKQTTSGVHSGGPLEGGMPPYEGFVVHDNSDNDRPVAFTAEDGFAVSPACKDDNGQWQPAHLVKGKRSWLVEGFYRWRSGQLAAEVADGLWAVTSAGLKELLSTPLSQRWQLAHNHRTTGKLE